MSKTRLNINLSLRIAQDSSGKDKFTKEFIMESLSNGNAEITRGTNSLFVTFRRNNDQIMAEVERIEEGAAKQCECGLEMQAQYYCNICDNDD